jgi:uncharacterized protein (DUF849 family)
MSPHLPITPREIADAAVGARRGGRGHRPPARARSRRRPSDAGSRSTFREFAADIARRSDVVVNFTTGGARR